MKFYRKLTYFHKIFILTFLLVYPKAYALIDFEDAIYPELVPSARALAMGNAFICKVDDSSAAFYNPAGLGTVRNTHFHLNSFSIETNKDYIQLGGNKAMDIASDMTGKLSLNGTRKLLLDSRGAIAHSRASFAPNFTTRYFSFGYMFAQRSRSTIAPGEDATFEYAFRQDHGLYGALNISLFGGIIKFGWTSVFLNRKEINDESDKDLGIVLTDNEFKKGFSIQHIGGARVTLPWLWLPTFAATIHNALDTDFTQRAGGQPGTPAKNLILGASVTPQIASTVRLHMEFNWRDFLLQAEGVNFTRRYSLGMELDFSRKAFIRIGYGDSYGSGGIGFKSQSMEMDLSTYAVDTSTDYFRGHEDRRFVISWSKGW